MKKLTLTEQFLFICVSIIVIAYFMYRDFKFMMQLQQTLQTLVDTVDCLKDVIGDNKV